MKSQNYWLHAEKSGRKRYAHVLHEPGAYENICEVYLIKETYMQPHRHMREDQIEKIELLEGSLEMIYFTDEGNVEEIKNFSEQGNLIKVPIMKYHTYRVISKRAKTRETMNGIYNPKTWKDYAEWAPTENSEEAINYLKGLKVK